MPREFQGEILVDVVARQEFKREHLTHAARLQVQRHGQERMFAQQHLG